MRSDDIEKEIQDKGLTAPRITPERLEEVLKSEQYYVFPGTTFTVCLLTLGNGYHVIGESACASPENFNAELVRKIARDNAKNKIMKEEIGRLELKRVYLSKSIAENGNQIGILQERIEDLYKQRESLVRAKELNAEALRQFKKPD